MKTVALTKRGMGKGKNEDLYLIKKINNGSYLFAIADGMGGEVAGEYAAKISLDTMADILEKDILDEKQLSFLVKKADRAVLNAAARDKTLEGMGCTLTCTLLRGGILNWSHVGDSRLYVLQQGALLQITIDQNMAQFLFEEGEISAEEMNVHPSRNQVDQSIGCGQCIPVMGKIGVNIGDMILLTTDGLHSGVTFQKMYSILLSPDDLETKARRLIKTASDSGGKDDMTLVIAEI